MTATCQIRLVSAGSLEARSRAATAAAQKELRLSLVGAAVFRTAWVSPALCIAPLVRAAVLDIGALTRINQARPTDKLSEGGGANPQQD